MNPAKKPLLVYDGECSFCRTWIVRWRRIVGEAVDCAPFQSVAGSIPDVPREALARAVHLVEPDGRITLAAEAVFRSLACARGHGWALWLYRFLPGFAPLSEACYGWVARHRRFCERLTRALWGEDAAPPRA